MLVASGLFLPASSLHLFLSSSSLSRRMRRMLKGMYRRAYSAAIDIGPVSSGRSREFQSISASVAAFS